MNETRTLVGRAVASDAPRMRRQNRSGRVMIFRLAAVLSPPAAADLLPALSPSRRRVRQLFRVVLARREGAGKP